MNNCRFCEIINGNRTDEEVLIENDFFIVLVDKFRKTSVGPVCLIIPKQHYTTILDLTEEYASKMQIVFKTLFEAMKEAFGCKAVRIWTAVNKEAGQSIFHCHIHFVPCNSLKDRIIASFPGIYDLKRRLLTLGNNELNKKQKFELAEKLRNQLKKTAK